MKHTFLFFLVTLSCTARHCPASPTVTSEDVEGPYFIPNTPLGANLIRSSVSNHTGASILIVTGVVMDQNCNHLPCAQIESWSADTAGHYKSEAPFDFRGRIDVDSDGRFRYQSILPGRYKIGDGAYRPAHVHIKVNVPNHSSLITQLYFKGDPYLFPNDACGSGCNSNQPTLIMQKRLVATDPASGFDNDTQTWVVDFPLVINVDTAKLPTTCQINHTKVATDAPSAPYTSFPTSPPTPPTPPTPVESNNNQGETTNSWGSLLLPSSKTTLAVAVAVWLQL